MCPPKKHHLLSSIDSLLCACLSLSLPPSCLLVRVFVLVGNQKDHIVSFFNSFRRKRRRKSNCVILDSSCDQLTGLPYRQQLTFL